MKIIFKSILIISMLFANSGGPGQGYAHNAPNYNNCTSCHSGSVNSGDGEVVFTGLPSSYIPGETYSIGVTVTGSNDRGYGFQAIAQAGNNLAGELSLNSNSSSLEVNGDFIQHSSRTTSGSWVFDWLAPSSDIGEVTFSASGLATGGANGNAGDEVYTEAVTIPALVPVDFEGFFF
ncbi:MAG: choice-of-anchor V domain-containing protein [Candidatus Neomarinimicrobiota bacterium]